MRLPHKPDHWCNIAIYVCGRVVHKTNAACTFILSSVDGKGRGQESAWEVGKVECWGRKRLAVDSEQQQKSWELWS